MNDIESALHSLADDGSGAPADPGLADRVLARARQRARYHGPLAAVGTAVAATLIAVGVITGAGALSGTNHLGAVLGPVGARTRTISPGFTKPRVNVLLVGTDVAPNHIGVHPDTIIVASIDTLTGDTTFFGLPRNLQQVPFPPGSRQAAAFPSGWRCPNAAAGSECMLDSLWTWAAQNGDLYYPGDRDPGLTAITQAAEQVTGLSVDENVVVNMAGLVGLVNAVGGVDVNVKERLPIGGSVERPVANGWLEPGRRHLDGYQALWFARSRWDTDDYDRMGRQQCLLSDLAQQLNAHELLTAYPKIAKVLKGNLSTSIPAGRLTQWAELAARMRDARIQHVGLATTRSYAPDFAQVRVEVAQVIAGTKTAGATTDNSSFSPWC